MKDKNVYIKNIPKTIDEKELKERLLEYGPIINAHLFVEKLDKMIVSKGFGFVCFE